MAEIKNSFLKGRMNQDLDSRILPEGEYREAINLLISRSEGNTVGEFENILGNIQIPTGTNLSETDASVIGHVVDETNNRGFLLLTNFSNSDISTRAASTNICLILEISFNSPYNIKTLVTGHFLNFNKCFPVTGINLVENLLFWTDNFNQPRKINIDLANPSSLATPTYYTEESQISVAKYYPYQPLLPMVRTSVVINSGSSDVDTLVFDTEQINIKVGDLVTDNNKGPGVTEKFTVPTRITKINSLKSFEFSPALGSPLPANFKVDLTRSSMENKFEQFESNYSLNNQTGAGSSPTTSFTCRDAGGNAAPNYGGLPRIGDIVSKGDATVGGVTNTAKIGGNLVGPLTNYITQNSTDATPNTTHTNATYTTSGDGTGAEIDVTVAGSTVTAVTVTKAGYEFTVGDTITVGTGVIGGSVNLVITLKAENITETRITGFILGADATTITALPYAWQITIDHEAELGTTKPTTSWVNIGENPNYDPNFKGDSKFLEERFVRFSYRFNFIDGEESLMAPFSQLMFIPKQYGEFGAGQLTSTVEQNSITYPVYNDDCDDAYKSTIIRWFENNTDSIGLKIPVPESQPSDLASNLLVDSIDILYKESDALAVKVLDTVEVSDMGDFSTIEYNDVIQGNVDQKFYDYQYKSTKPYKTLVQGDTTRVYDKVPIKALAQEIITNRVVYGNYTEKMTPPENLEYSASTTDRGVIWDNYVQYPYHNLKQNRTYQVGFVLADYYGRQSSVVLSSYDSDNSKSGSSVYLPYRDLTDATSSPVIDWLGKALQLTINSSIGQTLNYDTGEPGIYKAAGNVGVISTLTGAGTGYDTETVYQTSYTGLGTGCTVRIKTGGEVGGVIQTADDVIIVTSGKNYTTGDVLDIIGDGVTGGQIRITTGEPNPLGWYTYKIVVQQQEQEYYNVFTPGFINGLPVWGSTDQGLQRNKFALTTTAGENVNKIPRSLRSVGPTDNEFNSEETLFIRVTNKDALVNLDAATNLRTGSGIPWNAQYYPGQLSQNVLTIATMRDTEYGAIPFVAYSAAAPGVLGHQGEYGSTVTTVPISTSGGAQTTQPTGSIPWGDVGKAASFYAQSQNPFVIKINTTSNSTNQVGANVNDQTAWDGAGMSLTAQVEYAMEPFLSVVETKPVESLLGLFYETSMSGKLEVLNSGIDFGNPSVVSATLTSFDFPESTVANSDIGSAFKLVSGEGAIISSPTGLTVSISQVTRQSAPSSPIVDADGNPDYFDITTPSGSGELQLSTKSSKEFWYGTSSAAVNNSTDIYTIVLDCVRVVGAETYTSQVSIVATLTNVAPSITLSNLSTLDPDCNCPGGAPCPISITTATTAIKTFYGINGSADTNEHTNQLQWSLGTISVDDGSTTTGIFEIDASSGALTAAAGTLSDDAIYDIDVILTDVDGNGLTATCTTKLQVGYQRSPVAICTGVDLSSNSAYQMVGCNNGTIEYLFANTTDQALSAGGCCYPSASSVTWLGYSPSPAKLVNMGVIYGAGSCRADLFQGTLRIRGVLKGTDAACIGDASMKWFVQYRTVSGGGAVGPWGPPPTDAGSYQGTTYPTSGVGLSITGNGEDKGTSVTGSGSFFGDAGGWFFFDSIGEYRVITTAITGDFCTGACAVDKVKFYIEYGDGYYNSCTTAPCTP